jgi:serine/threonine-protein kinase
VALKRLLRSPDGPHPVREAELVARLKHPGIVEVYRVLERDGAWYVAMEYCPGGSLAARLNGGPSPALERDAEVLRRTALAVAAAHEAGVVHRDLKPANILLTAGGDPKVADFGLARALDDAGAARTTAAVLRGTPPYMAP